MKCNCCLIWNNNPPHHNNPSVNNSTSDTNYIMKICSSVKRWWSGSERGQLHCRVTQLPQVHVHACTLGRKMSKEKMETERLIERLPDRKSEMDKGVMGVAGRQLEQLLTSTCFSQSAQWEAQWGLFSHWEQLVIVCVCLNVFSLKLEFNRRTEKHGFHLNQFFY